MLEERLAKWEEELISQSRASGKAEGVMEGLIRGKAEGIAEGRAEGVAESLKTQKKALLSMIALCFPDYPQEWEECAAALSDAEAVGNLMIALMTVKSAAELANYCTIVYKIYINYTFL